MIQMIGRALDGSIDEQEFAKLQEELRRDSEAMAYYCEQAELSGRLDWELKHHVSLGVTEKAVPLTRANWMQFAAVAAGVALVTWFALTQFSPMSMEQSGKVIAGGGGQVEPLPEGAQSTLARVTNMQDAVWKDPSLRVGSWLTAGVIELISGNAEVTFDSGARVVIQGPAELGCLSPKLASLVRGKGVVHIPAQAEGFRLKTPSSSFADQSCSFALAVDEEETEVHVIEGSIEASPNQNMTMARTLNAKQSLRMNETHLLGEGEIRYAAGGFHSELPVSGTQSKARFLRWSFDSMLMDTFPESGSYSGAGYGAVLKQLPRMPGEAQAHVIKGKFGRALRFDGLGSYLETRFPGVTGAAERTVACWVRIPKAAQNKNAYSIVSWGEPQSQTGTKWQVSWNPGVDNTGQYGALRTEFGGGRVIGSANLRDGKWHHVTSVYLGASSEHVSSQVLHYVDGKLEAVTAARHQQIDTQVQEDEQSVAYIGRRLENESSFGTFHGAIDELYVFPAALTPSQIMNLYQRNEAPESLIPSLVNR
ncbi:LamG domain-containing protein [Oceaniferula marina]|nr:LamG domain-containing protein [Oceaniferula marina]